MNHTITVPDHMLRKTITALRQRQHRLEHLAEVQFQRRDSSLSRRENEEFLTVGNVYRREAGELCEFADKLCDLLNEQTWIESLDTQSENTF